MKSTGLVLSGGGARGAYQVGILKALLEISKASGFQVKFDYLSGVSAGAINACSLAANSEDFSVAVDFLEKLWSSVSADDVFSTDALTMGKIGLQWMSELSLGSVVGTTPGRALLNTSPLRNLIQRNMHFDKVDANIEAGHLKALAITALDYANSSAVTFIQGKDNLASWDKGRKKSERTNISTDHIMASSAIPLLFPPIQVDSRHFGDGCIRNQAPCAPVIYLGSEKLLIIGVRKQTSTAYVQRAVSNDSAPTVARVVNVLLNSVLLDSIEQDVERLNRLNDYAKNLPSEYHTRINLRPLDFVFISPSADIGEMAAQQSSKLPRVIRYLLKGLGPLEDASEIISYLLFDPEFCSNLIEVGYKDGMNHKDELIQLFTK